MTAAVNLREKTRDLYRRFDYRWAPMEQFIKPPPRSGRKPFRRDAWGCVDDGFFRRGIPGMVLTNTCHAERLADHRAKCEAEVQLLEMVADGVGRRFVLVAWDQVGGREKGNLWRVTLQEAYVREVLEPPVLELAWRDARSFEPRSVTLGDLQ